MDINCTQPASKQTSKALDKKETLPLPVVGNPMMHRPDTAATSSGMDATASNSSDSGRSSITTPLKKGRVVSDDEEEEDEAPVKRPSGLKRKSVALTSEDEETEPEKTKRSRLVKGKSSQEKEVEKLMDSDNDETVEEDRGE